MIFEDYVKATRRTWNSQDDPKANINHAMLGLIDETGEIAKAYKKVIGYNDKNLNVTNIQEEIGDLTYFLARLVDELGFEKIDSLYKEIDKAIDKEYKSENTLEDFQFVFIIQSRIVKLVEAMVAQDGNDIASEIINVLIGLKAFCDALSFDMRKTMEANIAKLKERYPEKFDIDLAANRDEEKESKAIEDVRDSKE